MNEYDLFSEQHGREVDDLLAQVRDLLGDGEAPSQPEAPASQEAPPAPVPEPVPEPTPEPTPEPAPEPTPEPAPEPEPTQRVSIPQGTLDRTQKYQPIQERTQGAVPEKRPVSLSKEHSTTREEKAPAVPRQSVPGQSTESSQPRPARQPVKDTASPQESKPAEPKPQAAPVQKAQAPKSKEPSPDKPLTRKERKALERQRRSEEPGSGYRSDPPTGYFWTSSKAALYVLGVLAASVLLALCLWLAADDVFGLTSPDQPAQVTVSQGDSLSEVADKLQEAGVIKYPFLFRLYGRLFDAESKIRPGDYTLNAMYDYRAVVVGMMGSYKARETARVTIPEGYTLAQIFDLLEKAGVCSVEDLTEAAAEYDFGYDFLAESTVEGAARLEGYLFPDTYEFYVADEPENVLDKLLTNFDQKFTEDMLEQLDVLNQELTQQANDRGIAGSFELTMNDIVTVASLIEKEASTSAERTTVASVIYNRLTDPNYPLLQIDATVLYALGDWSVALTYADLETDSPYNTYLYEGLPAGPICNPGINCLKAALYPSDTDYYYYALDTDGTHHFSHDAAEHQAFLDSLED